MKPITLLSLLLLVFVCTFASASRPISGDGGSKKKAKTKILPCTMSAMITVGGYYTCNGTVIQETATSQATVTAPDCGTALAVASVAALANANSTLHNIITAGQNACQPPQ